MVNIKSVAMFTAFAAGYVGAIYYNSSKINEQKKEIEQIDSARYNNAVKNLEEKYIPTFHMSDFLYNNDVEKRFWSEEYKAVKDSLKKNAAADSLKRIATKG